MRRLMFFNLSLQSLTPQYFGLVILVRLIHCQWQRFRQDSEIAADLQLEAGVNTGYMRSTLGTLYIALISFGLEEFWEHHFLAASVDQNFKLGRLRKGDRIACYW